MESYLIERPSVPQAAPALSLSAPACSLAAVAWSTAARAEKAAFGTILTVDVPRAHQVQIQALRGLIPALGVAGGYGNTGFVGTSVLSNTKRMDIRGIPPRGKPV
jgi:hypothetical protein